MAKKRALPAKADQTQAQRAKVSKAAIKELQKLVAGLPVEVLGHVEAPALCCRSGTVALVKVDIGDPPP